MSEKTNRPSRTIDREYGRRMYMSDKEYAEQIRIPTDKAAFDVVLKKHSEFKKPYLSDTYEEMEYFSDPPPGFDYFGEVDDFDTPWMGTPVPDFEGMYDPWHMTFFCANKPCFCEGETKRFGMGCTQEITEAYFFPSVRGLSVRATKTSVSVTAIEGYSGAGGNLTIVMKNHIPLGGGKWQRKYTIVKGTHGNIMVSRCSESECCDDTGIVWNGPKTIGPNESKSIAITDSGDGGPYTWTVSGTGYTLDYAITVGKTNILNASNACGVAVITVAGCSENVRVTGYVACTTGNWYACGSKDWPITTNDGTGCTQRSTNCSQGSKLHRACWWQYATVEYDGCTAGGDLSKSCPNGSTAILSECVGGSPVQHIGFQRWINFYYWAC